MDSKNINSALYTLLNSNNITEIKSVKLETRNDNDKISIGVIRFIDAHDREIIINVWVGEDADISTI
mgnify:CR=1 FL=1|jgi:hypothetical protein|tara:strand:+ start:728 stop:928 length:201 start_codon:yes stop_codon:yes gene_type:complete